MKNIVGSHLKLLSEVLLMITHNICFHGEIKQILCGYVLTLIWSYAVLMLVFGEKVII